MFDLKDKKALVTGASGGIGGAIARRLHAQQAHVVLSGRRQEALEALRAELSDRCSVAVADLGEPEGPATLLETVGNDGIDIFVNNAGLTRDNLAMRMKDQEWQEVLDVNLTSGFRLIRGLLRGMMKRRFGRIINITSVVATTGNPGQANYAAAKAGMIGMTKALAAEVASRGITVNCVAPGFIETAMTDGLPEEQKTKLLERIPIGKLGSGDDIAAAVGYLASPDAAYITGQTLHVNGGMAMI